MDRSARNKRRKLLKTIAAGTGAVAAGKSLPENWSRPVVDAVVLPGHAQTSSRVYAANLTVLLGSTEATSRMAGNGRGLLDVLVPGANAQAPQPPTEYLCITAYGNSFDARFARQYSVNDINEYRGEGGTLGGDLILPFFAGCGNAIAPTLMAWNPTPTGIEFSLDVGDVPLTGILPVDNCAVVPDGVCNIPSDRSIKENFAAVDEQDILSKVAGLPIEMWNYTDREQGVRHIGPMAQDFMAAFNVGDSERHINMVDANGVNLAAIKALIARLEEKDDQITELQAQLAEVMRRLDRRG